MIRSVLDLGNMFWFVSLATDVAPLSLKHNMMIAIYNSTFDTLLHIVLGFPTVV